MLTIKELRVNEEEPHPYENHLKDRLQPSRALAEAQRWLRFLPKEDVQREAGTTAEAIGAARGYPFEDLYYWGAFRVTGR